MSKVLTPNGRTNYHETCRVSKLITRIVNEMYKQNCI